MRTANRCLGLIRKGVHVGDKIGIFHGCSVPVILREHAKSLSEVEEELGEECKRSLIRIGDDHDKLLPASPDLQQNIWYEVLGECYVHGMMDGEAMTHPSRKDGFGDIFELR